MATKSSHFALVHNNQPFLTSLKLEPYVIKLRSAFGTAHSSTTSRTNVLMTFTLTTSAGKAIVGRGEIGMPPKKPYCYLADFDSISLYFDLFTNELAKRLLVQPYDPFQGVSASFFPTIRAAANLSAEELVFAHFLHVLDTTALEPVHRAARYGIEAAVMDAWSQLRNVSVSTLIFGSKPPTDKVSFFTVAINDDMEEIRRQTVDGLSFTPYLKIKLDANEERASNMLRTIYEEFSKRVDKSKLKEKRALTIDANSSWSVQDTRHFLSKIYPKYKDDIYMLEQPFVPNLRAVSAEELEQWKVLKEECGKLGLAVYADESCSVPADIEFLKPYVHGVNIKLEKSGGIREAIKILELARKHDLLVWIGIMVSSTLGSNVPAQLLPGADLGGDCDGHLWTTTESDKFEGGFTLDPKTGHVTFPESTGYGVRMK